MHGREGERERKDMNVTETEGGRKERQMERQKGRSKEGRKTFSISILAKWLWLETHAAAPIVIKIS